MKLYVQLSAIKLEKLCLMGIIFLTLPCYLVGNQDREKATWPADPVLIELKVETDRIHGWGMVNMVIPPKQNFLNITHFSFQFQVVWRCHFWNSVPKNGTPDRSLAK